MSTTLHAGTRLARYRILNLLGAGGMGAVYLATDLALQRSVAIKVLASDVSSAEAFNRFEREARTASSLNHPNIVTIYDVGREQLDGLDVRYIAMEYVDGMNLRKRMEIPAYSREDNLKVLAQVAFALGRVHRSSIVHRDLKPENVMVNGEGQAKIVDFGLAKAMFSPIGENDETLSPDRLTKTGLIVGTIGYMSPEQVRGEDLTSSSDTFSFGVILYELVFGKSPFRGKSSVDTLHRIVYSEPDFLRSENDDLAAKLTPLLKSCLDKRSDRRPTDIASIGAHIAALLAPADQSLTVVREAPPIRRGRLLHSTCDRMEQETAFVGTLIPTLRSRPYRPHAFFVAGEASDNPSSLVQRLAEVTVPQLVGRDTPDAPAEVIIREPIRWPRAGDMQQLRHWLELQVLSRLDDRKVATGFELSPENLARLPVLSGSVVFILPHVLLANDWNGSTVSLIRWYFRLWADVWTHQPRTKLLLFLSIQCPTRRPWMGLLWRIRYSMMRRAIVRLSNSSDIGCGITLLPELQAVSREDVLLWLAQHSELDLYDQQAWLSRLYKDHSSLQMSVVEHELRSLINGGVRADS